MLRGGWWKGEVPGVRQVGGYQINSLCCHLHAHRGFKNRWHELAAKFLKAKKGGPSTLQSFVNGQLAEVWQPEMEKATHPELLMSRAEDYPADPTEASERVMPEQSRLMTIGCDAQLDRLEAEFGGLRGPQGYGGSGALHYRGFKGDTRAPGGWGEVDDMIRTQWRRTLLS